MHGIHTHQVISMQVLVTCPIELSPHVAFKTVPMFLRWTISVSHSFTAHRELLPLIIISLFNVTDGQDVLL